MSGSKRLREVFVAAGSLLAGCSSIRAQIEIQAPRQAVWKILSETHSYAVWNPFVVALSGNLTQGETVRVTVKPIGRDPRSFTARVEVLEEAHRVVMRGRAIPLIFQARHHLVIEPIDESRVRFTQFGEFSGVLVPFADLQPTLEGWRLMNEALKQRAEDSVRNRQAQ